MFSKNKIKFLGLDELVVETVEPPVKASKALPEWIKALQNESEDYTTAKRCLPLVEASSEGYVWKTHCDIEFAVKENEKQEIYLALGFPNNSNRFPFNEPINVIDQHAPQQVYVKDQSREETDNLHGGVAFKQVYKLNNLFVIETPKGYSCRFKSLSNNFNIPLQIFEGVVETDHFYQIINFPFRYLGPPVPHKYILKKGTPLVQIIPFKREKWKNTVGVIDTKKSQKQIVTLRTIFKNAYRNQVRDNNGNT